MFALLLGNAVAAVLYGISPADPVALAGVLVVLTAVVAVAAWTPARRAARVDPMRALRAE